MINITTEGNAVCIEMQGRESEIASELGQILHEVAKANKTIVCLAIEYTK